jgi:hypothetical protein
MHDLVSSARAALHAGQAYPRSKLEGFLPGQKATSAEAFPEGAWVGRLDRELLALAQSAVENGAEMPDALTQRKHGLFSAALGIPLSCYGVRDFPDHADRACGELLRKIGAAVRLAEARAKGTAPVESTPAEHLASEPDLLPNAPDDAPDGLLVLAEKSRAITYAGRSIIPDRDREDAFLFLWKLAERPNELTPHEEIEAIRTSPGNPWLTVQHTKAARLALKHGFRDAELSAVFKGILKSVKGRGYILRLKVQPRRIPRAQ